MNGGAKLLGHSIHPILIVFPLGLLATATIFDILGRLMDNASLASAAYWMLLAGLVGGALAAVFGWIDWFAIPGGTRAKRIGLAHGLTNAAALVIYACSFYLRIETPASPPLVATVLLVVASAAALVGGWLGGELVERLGIGVHPGANPDAPNSLTNDSAYAADAKK